MASVRLYKSTETDFTHNENVLSEIENCKVTEELNGDYTVELEYPLDDSKGISNSLVVGAILSIPTIDNRSNQLFRIIAKDTDSFSTIVQGQAKLLADLKENRVKAMTLTGLTRKHAIQTVLNAALEPHIYTVGNLDTNINNDVIVNIQEGSILSAIIGEENSILSEYGGEFIVNNNTIDIIDSRGSDNGITIEYGKNLSSIKESIDITDLATVLIPKNGDYRLPEYIIESPLVGNYEKRYFKEVEFNLDIWDGTDEQGEEQITETEAYALMRQACNKMFRNDHVDQITFNYQVNMIELSKTEEYKDYAVLETVNLGDTVTIKHKKLNLDLQGRVNKVSYRVNSNGETLLDTVEIGFKKKDITDIINTTVKQIQFTKEEIKLELNNNISRVNVQLKLADDKMNAVVEKDGTGMGWQLKQDAFIVACQGASGASVTIDRNGQTIDDGKFKIRKNGDTVFKVNTSGVCNAVGGFIVDSGDIAVEMTDKGLQITNSNGYTGLITVSDVTKLLVPDDFEVGDDLNVGGICTFENKVFIKSNLSVDGNVKIGDETLEDYIIRIIGENT